jgi:hypothetical protein
LIAFFAVVLVFEAIKIKKIKAKRRKLEKEEKGLEEYKEIKD